MDRLTGLVIWNESPRMNRNESKSPRSIIPNDRSGLKENTKNNGEKSSSRFLDILFLRQTIQKYVI